MDTSIFIYKTNHHAGNIFLFDIVRGEERKIGFDPGRLEKFAQNMKNEIEVIKREWEKRVFISFSLPQNILCLPEGDPLLCENLSDEEQKIFWKYFSGIANREVHNG